RLHVRCRLGQGASQVPLRKLLLVKAHETALSTGQEFFPGSSASLRCEVHGVRSLTRTVPLGGADVAVSLRRRDGKVFPVCKGKAGADGVLAVNFKVPAVPPGSY